MLGLHITDECLEQKQKMSMIRKYHNHKLQTTPWHREEEPLSHHKTPGRQIKQSKQLSLFPIKGPKQTSYGIPGSLSSSV